MDMSTYDLIQRQRNASNQISTIQNKSYIRIIERQGSDFGELKYSYITYMYINIGIFSGILTKKKKLYQTRRWKK